MVSSVGDCVAVLCQLTPDGVFSVRPLGILHNIESEDEALRLANMGLNVAELQQKQPHMLTRCIGNYALKKCYQSFDVLRLDYRRDTWQNNDLLNNISVSPTGKLPLRRLLVIRI